MRTNSCHIWPTGPLTTHHSARSHDELPGKALLPQTLRLLVLPCMPGAEVQYQYTFVWICIAKQSYSCPLLHSVL